MTKENEIITKISKCYVGDNCVQVMCPYKDSITILDKDGIMYHHVENSHFFINDYTNDERRKQFPYHNIPTHYSKSGFNNKVHKTNQLFNFKQPYIQITDGNIIESFVIKDKNEALLVNKILSLSKKTELKTRKEVENLLNPPTNIQEKRYFFDLNGIMRKDNMIILPSEKDIYENAKESLLKNVEDFRTYVKNSPYSAISSYLRSNPLFLDFAEKSINTSDLSGFKLDIPLIRDNIVIIAKTNNSEIILKGINICFIETDCYKVDIFDIPITKYTLEQLKYLAKEIVPMEEPNISLKLNPGVRKEDIKKAKTMINKRK